MKGGGTIATTIYRSVRVPVKEGWEHHRLASDVYKERSYGKVLLLKAGHRLTLANIHQLQSHGITHIDILAKKVEKEEG